LNRLDEDNIVACKSTTHVQNLSTSLRGFTFEEQREMVMIVLVKITAHLNMDLTDAEVNDPRLRYASNECFGRAERLQTARDKEREKRSKVYQADTELLTR
jgi:hypothetical protein